MKLLCRCLFLQIEDNQRNPATRIKKHNTQPSRYKHANLFIQETRQSSHNLVQVSRIVSYNLRIPLRIPLREQVVQ